MLKNATIGLMTFLAVSVTIIAVGLHYNERNLYRAEVNMTSSDSDYLQMALKKRSAGDCIVEPTDYGWKCTDFKGRVYKVAKKENNWKKTARSNSAKKSNYKIVAKADIE
jgi:hypothetical protein